MKYCINDVNFIRFLLLSTELCKFEIQKYGQIYVYISPIFSCQATFYEYSKSNLLTNNLLLLSLSMIFHAFTLWISANSCLINVVEYVGLQ